jgi:cellulose synthase/poly-beta-1,6-N-acetylglucosamine synthase-like glycosyltransferase
MRVAALIAAHNEAEIISDTVARTARAMAPHPVFVVADRCTDSTASRAREAGATVYERAHGPVGKGAAIAWFLEAAGEAAHLDALVILDADSRLQPHSLAPLVQALSAGADAAQGLVYPIFDTNSPLATLVAYNEWLSQMVDDRLRARLRWPVRLRGTGMAIRTSVLRDAASRLKTRVEDAELTILLLCERRSILFVADAVVEDPKPSKTFFLTQQRARWLQGDRDIWRFHRRAVLRALATFNPGAWWLTSSLLLKPRSLVTLAKVGASLALWPFATYPMVRLVLWALLFSVLSTIVYYLAGVLLVPAEWRRPVLRALARAPLYLLMWVRAFARSLKMGEAWLRARD